MLPIAYFRPAHPMVSAGKPLIPDLCMSTRAVIDRHVLQFPF